MKIYTKTGDKGQTSLLGGQRVPKDEERLNAYGNVDELNSALGFAGVGIRNIEIKKIIISLQNKLFKLGADLSTPLDNKKVKIERMAPSDTKYLEELIDKINVKLPELKNFILPGGTDGAARLQLARAVCRRAERSVVSLSKKEEIGNQTIVFLNRLSDLLFVLARYENYVNNEPDIEWANE